MPKVRRNDPCPCGSGKKYKNCCMRRDQINESRERNLSELEAALLNGLFEYAQAVRFASDLSQAFTFYWGGAFELASAKVLSGEDIRRMFEWFFVSYRTQSDGRRIIDFFLEEKGPELIPEAREILEAWAQAIPGVFRVLSTEGEEVSAYDCLRQEELTIHSPWAAQNARPGELLVGYLYDQAGEKHLMMMALLLPGEYEPGLVEFVTNAYNLYRDEHPQASWDEFLRENAHIFNAYLLSPKAEALRSLIGPGTRYDDPAIARDKLRAWAREKAQAEQRQVGREPARPREQRTAAGIILPGAAEPATPSQKEDPSRPTILIPGRDL